LSVGVSFSACTVYDEKPITRKRVQIAKPSRSMFFIMDPFSLVKKLHMFFVLQKLKHVG